MENKNGNTPDGNQGKLCDSQEMRSVISKLSEMLNTGLTEEQLQICIQLCEAGVNPSAVAEVVRQIRSQVAELKAKEK